MLVERAGAPTETFIANEVAGLEAAGAEVQIIACSGSDRSGEALAGPDSAPARMLEESRRRMLSPILAVLFQSPRRSAATFGLAVAAAIASPRGIWRAIRAWALACRMSRDVRSRGFSLIHAQFINRPALVGVLLSRWTRVPCTVSAHARDVFVPDFRLSTLVRAAQLVVVCSSGAHHRLGAQAGVALAGKIRCVHHGLDLIRFGPRAIGPEPMPARYGDPAASGRALRILTVARLVPKKGVDTVLRALAVLASRGWAVRLHLVGDGPERQTLLQMAEASRIELDHRPRAEHAVIDELLGRADVFALGCTTAHDGDRDGLPNSILEAMASGVPVVTCSGGSVGDAVEHGRTGLLAPPGDAILFADAIEEIATQPELRRRLVANARALIEAQFDRRRNGADLLALLAEASDDRCHRSA
jgi:glycosyltransferase involved in cell wall biosynthesis